MSKDFVRGQNGELIMAGYKGKGMCSNCICSYPKKGARDQTLLQCSHYKKWCFLVSRNCPGIRSLKPK